MSVSEVIGFRANYKKDADIFAALANAVDRTQELKNLIRLGIAVKQGKVMVQPIVDPKLIPKKTRRRTIDWRPAETMQSSVDITKNILGGFE